MVFQPQDTLTEEQLKEGLSNVIRDGITSQTMTILTGGAFLTAFAFYYSKKFYFTKQTAIIA